MAAPTVDVKVSDGQIQGVVGAGSVVIENFTIYNRAADEPTVADAELIPPCPYPGLAYFGPNDADLFFGRDAAITRLEAAVERQSFTALVGASGSGKSSVVLAGLAPRLHGRGNWRVSHFRIGTELESNPFLALARALAPLYVASDSDVERLKNTKLLAKSLAAGELTLLDVFADCRSRNKGRRILLIADQFEEAFTLVNDELLRHRFIDLLLLGFSNRAAADPPDICLVLTLRADFYGMALRHRPLADALQGRVENLGPMTRDELREAIARPAGAITFENGLVDTLLDDVGNRPGSLPLLQFALREMWGRLDKRRMTRAIYEAIGGVEGALAQRAQAVFEDLTNDSRDAHSVMLFRRLFTRLVGLGEGAEDTRRIVGREELGQESWALAQRLASEGNRLIVTSAPAPDHENAEVVHEALIRNWPTLIDWVNRDRAFQYWLRLLKPRVDEWREHPEDNGTLLRGGPLTVAEEWVQRRGDEVSENERSFIDRSLKHREVEREQRDRLLRRGGQMRALVGVLFVGMVAGLAYAGWLNRSHLKIHMSALGDRMLPKVLSASAERALKANDIFKECSQCPEMVVVPVGEFTMGSPANEKSRFSNEGPQHRVKIEAFAASRSEVTFDQWDACNVLGGCASQPWDQGWGRGSLPVINVTWDEAQQYVAWLSKQTGRRYRLLTESEWEYAARAGRSEAYTWGEDVGRGNANCVGCGSRWDGRQTAPVGSFAVNAFGLFDMAGNVWEWVRDCYHATYQNAPLDGSARTDGDCANRIIRGGSWNDRPQLLRSANRSGVDPNYRDSAVGFRVGRTLGP